MAADSLKSASITNLDSLPVVPNNTGVGAQYMDRVVDDWCAVTAVGIATLASVYKLVRIPTYAIIKSLNIATDVILDSNSSNALALDFGFCFSDSTIDGTPSSLQGLIPTTANTGATTTFGTYSSPNNIFGTFAPPSHTVALAFTNITFNKGNNAAYLNKLITTTPLWQLFGFKNSQGVLQDPGGFFDLYAYVSTAAATGNAGNLYARVGFAI